LSLLFALFLLQKLSLILALDLLLDLVKQELLIVIKDVVFSLVAYYLHTELDTEISEKRKFIVRVLETFQVSLLSWKIITESLKSYFSDSLVEILGFQG